MLRHPPNTGRTPEKPGGCIHYSNPIEMTVTNKQKLELTWIRKENRSRLEPHVRIELADDPQQEGSPVRCHEATLAICPEPRLFRLAVLAEVGG
jgi:hypothetical protein